MPLTCHRDSTAIDWNDLAAVIAAGFPIRQTSETVRAKFLGSHAVSFVVDGGKLIGIGRAISDGVASSAIYDVVVLPEHQGRGAGRLIMQDLLAQLPAGSILLVPVPGKEEFYAKLGFRRLKYAMLLKDVPASWIAGGYFQEI